MEDPQDNTARTRKAIDHPRSWNHTAQQDMPKELSARRNDAPRNIWRKGQRIPPPGTPATRPQSGQGRENREDARGKRNRVRCPGSLARVLPQSLQPGARQENPAKRPRPAHGPTVTITPAGNESRARSYTRLSRKPSPRVDRRRDGRSQLVLDYSALSGLCSTGVTFKRDREPFRRRAGNENSEPRMYAATTAGNPSRRKRRVAARMAA